MFRYSRVVWATAIVVMVACVQTVQAEQSHLAGGYLTVPRIDVDEFGPFQMVFRLEFDGEFQFVLIDSAQAEASLDHSGKFDPQQTSIKIDEILLETGELYAVRMALVSATPEMVFKMTDAELLNPGAEVNGTLDTIALQQAALHIEGADIIGTIAESDDSLQENNYVDFYANNCSDAVAVSQESASSVSVFECRLLQSGMAFAK